MWSQFTNVTDGRTDRQTTCDRNTALCTKVHRAVKTVHFWLKYNGLGIVRRTTKLIEGGHRRLQDYGHICYYFYVFMFLLSFSKSTKSWLFTFFAVFHTFSRTMPTSLSQCVYNMQPIITVTDPLAVSTIYFSLFFTTQYDKTQYEQADAQPEGHATTCGQPG